MKGKRGAELWRVGATVPRVHASSAASHGPQCLRVLVSVRVNTPPVLPSLIPHCVDGTRVCPRSRLLTSALPIVSFFSPPPLPFFPSSWSNRAFRPGSFRFGRQAWATGECHFSVTLPLPVPVWPMDPSCLSCCGLVRSPPHPCCDSAPALSCHRHQEVPSVPTSETPFQTPWPRCALQDTRHTERGTAEVTQAAVTLMSGPA